MKKISLLNITKPFWAIVRRGDPKGYHTGFAKMETVLIETDTATELTQILSDGSVEAGESMGDYVFKELAVSHDYYVLESIEEHERLEKEQDIYSDSHYEQRGQ